MGRHHYVLGRGIKPFHQALGQDAMLSAHPLLADGPTSLRPRPRHQAFPPGSRPRRNVVGPSVASGWADIATLATDGPTSLRPRPSYGAFPPGSRPRRNVVGPSIASGWADIATSSAEASSFSTRLSAETQCCRPIRCQRMGRHRYVLGRAMEPFHQALGRDAMLSAHPLPADGPTSLRPRPRHQAFSPGSRPRRNVVGPSIASGWADIATSIHQALGRV